MQESFFALLHARTILYPLPMINWSNKRVVVTGGTGFIGSVLVEELLKRGAVVRVPIRAKNFRSLSQLRSKIEWVDGDLRDPEYCRGLIMGMDHVFHLASYRRNVAFHRSHSADVMIGNVEMSLALTQALKDYPHAGVTFFSSANVPPEIDVIKLAREESADGYVLGKAMAEALWFTAEKQYGFKLLVVRPVGVYGERDTFTIDGNVIPSLMVKAEEATTELTVWGSGKQERVFVYAPDLVQAVFRLLDHDARGVQYVLPPDTVTISQVASIVSDLIRPGLRIVPDTSKPEGKRSIAVLSNHPCLADFPWTSLPDGIRKTYEGWKGIRHKS